LLALALVLAFLPNTSQLSSAADDPADAAAYKTDAVDPVGAAAMRVRLDPESGTLLLDTSPMATNKATDLEAMLSRSDEGLVSEFLPNGTVRVDLQGRFQNASVAHIGADGRIHTNCTDQLHEAQDHLTGTDHAASEAPVLEVK
jgi:hypothetical protein